MLSKNNFKEVTKRDAQRTPHYGLRKLSVGVASVLLSTTLYAGLNAQADTVTPGANNSDTSSQAFSVDSLVGSATPTDPAAPASIAAPKTNQDGTGPVSVPASATAGDSKTTLTPTNATSNSLIASKVVKPLVLMAQSGSTPAAVTDSTASVAQGIKDTGVGGTFNKLPQYTAKSSSIEFGGTNFTKINNYNVNLSRESSFEFSVKGKFTLDGSQIKKDRQILLGTILFTNNFYTDPNNAAHNQHMLVSWGGPIIVTSSNGKEIGYAQLSNANGAEADWTLHVTSVETWVGDINISLNIPLAGYVGYFTDTAVYKNVTTAKPWVETVQTPDNMYKLTYTLHAFTNGWRYYQNSVGRDKGSIYFTKIAPALQTSEKYPSATLQDTLGKAGPADAKPGSYKFVVKVSGLGTPILVTPGVGFESSFYPVDQNNHVIAEMIGYYGNVNGTSNKLANNLTAQQLYDQVGAHQTLYSVQDDGSMLIATEITPADIYLSDERIIQELQHGSMLYATASLEDQQKIIKNTLAFYHGVLKNTPLITRTYFRTDDGNGFRNAIIDSGVQDVTPLSSGRAPVPDVRYYKVGAPSASASGDLLQHNYVYYVDGAEGNKVISTTDLAGKAGDTKTITVTIPTGYVLDQARTGSMPASYVLKDGNNTPIYIYLKHTTVQVTPDQPKTTRDKLPDNPTKSYPAGVGQNDLNKTVTRTIQVTDPHTQKITTTPQSVHLTRTADVDEVSGAVTYGKWTTGEWPVFNTPSLAGYTSTQANVAKVTVTDTAKDQIVKITYNANAQTTHVKYVDKDNPSNVIHTTSVSGKTDRTVNVPSEVPAGWQLVSGQSVPKNVTFTATGYPDTTVKIEHKHVIVTPDHSKTPVDKLPDNPTKSYPAGVGQKDLNKVVIRTIQVVDPHTQKVATTTQTVNLTRTADVDEVSGAVTYGKWTSGEWPIFNTSSVAGYTPTQASVAKTTVTDTTKDQTVKITYAANPQSTMVNYVDSGNQVIHSTAIKGVTDQTVSVPNEVPTGWKLSIGSTVPLNLTFGPTGYPVVTVHIEHHHVTVTPAQPKTSNDKLPNNPTKSYPAGVGQNDLNKTLTRTIQVVDPHTQKVTATTQSVHLTRTANVDEVDGTVTYGKWTTGEWSTFNVPGVAGYTPSQASINQATVTDTTKDRTIKITYTANAQTTQVNYVDQSGKVVHSTLIKGVTDQTVTVPNEVPANWQLVSGQTVPSQLTFGPDGHPAVIVKIEHQTTTTREQKTITRTINYVGVNGNHLKPSTVQTLSFARTGVQDLVTKAITWNSTPNQSFAAVNDLDILGYRPDMTTVPAVTVNWDTQNSIVDVHYQVAKSTVTVNLVDTQGHIIATTPVTGQVGSMITLPVSIPDGWVVYNADLPARVVIGSRPTELDYLIAHRLAFVKASDNVKAGDLIPGTKTKIFNDQVNADNLVMHAYYTVNIWADEAHTHKLATKTYHTDFIRNAMVDAVTGEVYYYNWSEGGKHVFAGFTRPAGDGYQAVVVPAWTATQTNPTKTLGLVAQPQQVSGTIQYQTSDGTVVSRQTFTGDKTVTLTAPKGYTLMTDVTTVKPALGRDQMYTVYVRPTQTLYTAADKLPEGVESLSKTITRTIHITEANGHVRIITQRVHFTRTATVNTDGKVTYTNWKATGRAVWNKVFLPKRHGYHVVIDGRMDKMNVTGVMSDVMVNVQYVKD